MLSRLLDLLSVKEDYPKVVHVCDTIYKGQHVQATRITSRLHNGKLFTHTVYYDREGRVIR